MLTIEDVKRDLPEVKIQTADGRIVPARVYGRNMPFATVSNPSWGSFGFEVAWETVQRCINTNRPILL